MLSLSVARFLVFFFNVTATTEIYSLSLHDALPISSLSRARTPSSCRCESRPACTCATARSEENTSELESPVHIVCRLLREKKKDGISEPWRWRSEVARLRRLAARRAL